LVKDWIAGDWQAAEIAASPFRNQFRRRPAADDTPVAATANQSIEELIALMAPDSHPTPKGLAATRIYSQRLARGSLTQ
jgi:hypothetical protein